MGSDRFPTTDWERVDPEDAGWSRQKLEKAERWSRQIKSIAVMVVHHGLVVAEWGDIVGKTELASVRKSLLSALIGIAVERKELELSRTIGSLGIDDNEPSLTPEEKSTTVRDLLQSRSGVYHAALYEARAAADARPVRHSHKPGAFWYYNNWDFNTLGTIYERAARSSIFDAFEREIAGPIGMQDYQPSDGRYIAGEASVYPAYPIKMSARDLARFALLYLNKGRWQDRQIIPAAWVEESTKAYSHSDLGAGYGYMWWTAPISNGVAPSVSLPDGTFYAAGTGGQYAFVIPTYDLVVVHRAPHPDGRVDLRTVGRLLWLLLDAGRFPDIGPDASFEAAQGMRASGDMLSRMLMGKTLYSGEGFVWLQRLVEAITRDPIDVLLHRLVFEPLEMRNRASSGNPPLVRTMPIRTTRLSSPISRRNPQPRIRRHPCRPLPVTTPAFCAGCYQAPESNPRPRASGLRRR